MVTNINLQLAIHFYCICLFYCIFANIS